MDSVQGRSTAARRRHLRPGRGDAEDGRPVFSHEPAFDGTEGMKVHYLSNLKRQMTMASKVWSESWFDDGGRVDGATAESVSARPIEKVRQHRARLDTVQRETPNEAWPIPWPYRHYPGRAFPVATTAATGAKVNWSRWCRCKEMINKAVLDEARSGRRRGTAQDGHQRITLT